jgi:hypothetical protein
VQPRTGLQLSQITAQTPVPLFAGMSLFGDFDSFAQPELQHYTAAAIDEFLQLPEGTTTYGADPSGRLFAIQGKFLGASSGIVEAQLAQLESFIGVVADYRRPTGDIYPSIIWPEHNCYFTAGDLVFGSIQQVGVSWFSLSYSLIIRQIKG